MHGHVRPCWLSLARLSVDEILQFALAILDNQDSVVRVARLGQDVGVKFPFWNVLWFVSGCTLDPYR
jgi:hypothetical protein